MPTDGRGLCDQLNNWSPFFVVVFRIHVFYSHPAPPSPPPLSFFSVKKGAEKLSVRPTSQTLIKLPNIIYFSFSLFFFLWGQFLSWAEKFSPLPHTSSPPLSSAPLLSFLPSLYFFFVSSFLSFFHFYPLLLLRNSSIFLFLSFC